MPRSALRRVAIWFFRGFTVSAFWLQLVAALTTWLTEKFGKDFSDWFAKIFSSEAEKMPEPNIAVGAAPDEVKDLIRGLVVELVEKALASRPIMKRLVLAVVKNLPDTLLDTLWDSLFAPKTMAASPTFSASDLAAAKAEAGI